MIIAEFSNLCLERSTTDNVEQDTCSSDANQRFEAWRVDFFYRFEIEGTNECMAVEGADTERGANVVMEPCDFTADHQLWELSGDMRNRVLKAKHSGRCLSLSGTNELKLQPGANLVVWDCTAAPERKFYVSALDNR